MITIWTCLWTTINSMTINWEDYKKIGNERQLNLVCGESVKKKRPVRNKGSFCLKESHTQVRNVQRCLWRKQTNKPTFLLLLSGREQSRYSPIAWALSPTGVSGSAEIKLLSHFLPHNYLVGFLTCKTFFLRSLVLHLFSLPSLAPQGWESRCH